MVRNRLMIVYVLAMCLLLSVGAVHADDKGLQKLTDEAHDRAMSSLKLSRAFMLGERKPDGRSIVLVSGSGEIKNFRDNRTRELLTPLYHPRGGPGTRYYMFNRSRKVKGPLADYNWHQKELRAFLNERRGANEKALSSVKAAHEVIFKLVMTIQKLESIPEGYKMAKLDEKQGGRLAYSWNQMLKAVEAGDKVALNAWGWELLGASMAIQDLHGWTDLLYANQLFTLDFQKDCKELFEAYDKVYGNKYNTMTHIARFPGGNASLYGADNYAEVERQAEGFFWFDGQSMQAVDAETASVLATIPVDLRESWLTIHGGLPKAHQLVWEEATGAAYERSYLVNVLWRAKESKTEKQLLEVLKRYAKKYRKPSVEEMMDVIHHRGSYFAGLEFGDRYTEKLMDAGARWRGKNDRVAQMAHRWTYGLYGGKQNYTGLILTLRESSSTGKMDCIRATDMIAATYRNSGQPGYRMVRMFRGGLSHTVAAVEAGTARRSKVMTIDGLIAGGGVRAWPKGYAEGGKYNVGNKNSAYAVQLYVRAIDGYVTAEAYYVHGPEKGKVVKTRVPYIAVYEGVK